ncbi:MAG: glycosyltransferase family 2 protein [Phycisphaerales bacterium]
MSAPATHPSNLPAPGQTVTPEALYALGRGIDILIPTLNEASHIVETVENARAVGNVYVLDSHSSDGTQKLARDAGAVVVENTFIDYAKQKNWGLDNLPFTGEWVFILDADERITPELRDELFRLAAGESPTDGYYVNRVVLYMGHAVRHGGLYPSWNLRFFRRGRCRYEDRAVHEHMVCDGPTEYLKHEMLHIRRESLFEWIRKHIKYADLESTEWIKLRSGLPGAAEPERLFRDTLRYRWWLRRQVWPRTPFRPLLRFMYMYIVRLGLLDGMAGLRLAALTACYEYMIGLMHREKRARLRGDLKHS